MALISEGCYYRPNISSVQTIASKIDALVGSRVPIPRHLGNDKAPLNSESSPCDSGQVLMAAKIKAS